MPAGALVPSTLRHLRSGHGRYVDRSHRLLAYQATYYGATGVWPLLSRSTFEMVTGRKRDFWLAQQVGLLTAVIAGVIGLALRRADAGRGERAQAVPVEVETLAMTSTVAFAAIDATIAWRRGRPVAYLGDLVLQLIILRAGLRLRQARGRTSAGGESVQVQDA